MRSRKDHRQLTRLDHHQLLKLASFEVVFGEWLDRLASRCRLSFLRKNVLMGRLADSCHEEKRQ